MNKHLNFFSLLLILCLPFFSFAQENSETEVGKYRKVILNMEDGHQKEGYIKEFRKAIVIKTAGAGDSKSVEKDFGFQTPSFVFRKTPDAKKEKLSIKDIKSIDFVLGIGGQNIPETHTLEKVKLATIKNNKKLEAESVYTLLPVFYKNQKITVYGFICDDVPRFYFRGDNDGYALYQKIKFSDIFNIQKYNDRLYGIFEYIGRDCPDYLNWLKNSKEPIRAVLTWGNHVPEGSNSGGYQDIEEKYQKDIKKAKNEMSKDEFEEYYELRTYQKDKEMTELYFGQYDKFVTKFIESCN